MGTLLKMMSVALLSGAALNAHAETSKKLPEAEIRMSTMGGKTKKPCHLLEKKIIVYPRDPNKRKWYERDE